MMPLLVFKMLISFSRKSQVALLLFQQLQQQLFNSNYRQTAAALLLLLLFHRYQQRLRLSPQLLLFQMPRLSATLTILPRCS
jgi:hypothetical protein